MTLSESVKLCLGPKYLFRFAGRASRSEFWWFMLFIFGVNLATGLLFALLPPMLSASLSLAVSLALLPANLGVTVRRFHDRNLSGWWLLLPIALLFLWLAAGGPNQEPGLLASGVSLAMCVCYLAILCSPGTPGPNKYGPPAVLPQAG
ncbi:MAG: DUF805 domain-containing protein [Desulfovibrio sp.]|nr:DUF805 domain-containing protein [Desulfovibrio sp.]